MMSCITENVRRIAMESGADLVGFAPVSRFENAPPVYHPHTIYPQTKTVIAFALVQPRGALKTVEEGTYWQSYTADSYWYLNEVKSAEICRNIIMYLEGEGYTSVAVHNPFKPHLGRKVNEEQPAGPDGMVSLRVIGVAAGLGEIGHSKIFLTPQFGPRQRIFAVFTDAELEPTPLFTGKICDGCLACVRECEACAISRERDVKFTIDGHEYSHAQLDTSACFQVHWGLDPRFSPFWTGNEEEGQKPLYNKWILERFRHLSICVGRGCIRACLDHLEKTGRIEAKFKTPFIQHKRWKLNEAPKKQEKTE
jgi:ferredoxin